MPKKYVLTLYVYILNKVDLNQKIQIHVCNLSAIWNLFLRLIRERNILVKNGKF